jgi:hypothetical protein
MKFHNTKILRLIVALVSGATVFSCTRDTLQKISSTEILERPEEEIQNLKIVYTSEGKLTNVVIAEKALMLRINDTALYIFPEGLYVASYRDSIMESDLKADSATLKENPNFFTAVGNVVARNVRTGKRMETEGPLYWHSGDKTIETKVYSTIYTQTDTIYAKNGIFSDDKFTNVLLRKQSGTVFK